MNGMDMMMQSMIKAVGIDPEKIMQIAGQFQETLQAFKEQMDRIEKNQNELLILLRPDTSVKPATLENEQYFGIKPLNGNGHA